MKNINIKGLKSLRAYFNTEEKCIKHLESIRWGKNPYCPYSDCGNKKVYRLKDKKSYKCSSCKRRFNVKIGTIFEGSKIPFTIWFEAFYLVISHRKGVSSLQLSRDLEITQKTAWFLLHRIRYVLKGNFHKHLLKGIVEADETYVGGKNKNRHKNKRYKESQGRSTKDKIPVLGILERGGDIVAMPVEDTKGSTIEPIINQHVEKRSKIMTDEWWAYQNLGTIYDHGIVKHRAREYVRDGIIHTNTVEGFWSLLKRGIIGIYHSVSSQHLKLYVDEFVFRYNGHRLSEYARFEKAIKNVEGRLLYKVITTQKKKVKLIVKIE